MKFFFISISIILSFIPALVKSETITITTYYPSPSGVYKDIKTESIVIGDVQENPPDKGVLRFAPQNQPSSGKAGDIYFDQSSKRFKYYNGSEWKNLGTEGGTCTWFRDSCPYGWDDLEQKEVSQAPYPTTYPAKKEIWINGDGSSTCCFGCNTMTLVRGSKYGVYNRDAACKKCFGSENFKGTELLDAPSGWPCRCVYSHSSVGNCACKHYRCVYEGEPPTPPLVYKYTLHYCCPP